MTKILIFDVETAPNLAYVWGKWKQNIGSNMFVSKSYIMSFAAKWLGDDEIIYIENRHGDDTHLVSRMYELFDEADVVVAHNGNKFDIPRILGRGLVHGFKPPSPYHKVDTLLVARKKFGFVSNTLADLCVELGLPLKGDHKKFAGFDLWLQCLKQNDEAWDEMREYNIQDILSLEALYLRMRPYMDNHPNVGKEEHSCPNCGSVHVQKRGMYRPRRSGLIYQRWSCTDCGSWSRSKSMEKTLVTNNLRGL